MEHRSIVILFAGAARADPTLLFRIKSNQNPLYSQCIVYILKVATISTHHGPPPIISYVILIYNVYYINFHFTSVCNVNQRVILNYITDNITIGKLEDQ